MIAPRTHEVQVCNIETGSVVEILGPYGEKKAINVKDSMNATMNSGRYFCRIKTLETKND